MQKFMTALELQLEVIDEDIDCLETELQGHRQTIDELSRDIQRNQDQIEDCNDVIEEKESAVHTLEYKSDALSKIHDLPKYYLDGLTRYQIHTLLGYRDIYTKDLPFYDSETQDTVDRHRNGCRRHSYEPPEVLLSSI